jgi:hypothetical protein
MSRSTRHKLALVCLISSAVPPSFALTTAVHAAKSVGLLRSVARDTQTCGGESSLSQCSNNLPSDFCCPSGSACMQLNNTAATSVICCPQGSDCKLIQPITCDVSRLNATLFPENLVHSADLAIALPTCGDSCCPLGYACQNGACSLLNSSTVSPSAPASAAPTSGSVAIPTSSPSISPTPIPETALPSQSHKFSGTSFAAGFIPGLVLGAILLYGVMWAIKQRRKRKSRYSGDFGPVSYNVSDPIYNPILGARTDFLRRASVSTNASPGSSLGTATLLSASSRNGAGQPGMSEAFKPASKGKSLLFRSPRLEQDPYMTPTRTPNRMASNKSKASSRRSNLTRSGSTETIDVLMPTPSFLLAPPPALRAENGRPLTSDTTFTNLMAHAGFGRDSQDGVRKLSTRLQSEVKNV